MIISDMYCVHRTGYYQYCGSGYKILPNPNPTEFYLGSEDLQKKSLLNNFENLAANLKNIKNIYWYCTSKK